MGKEESQHMDNAKEKLRRLIKERCLSEGNFILSSGGESSLYLDTKKITYHREGLFLISHLFAEKIREQGRDIDAIGGPATGANPLVAAMALLTNVEGFVVRKENKTHGALNRVDGNLKRGWNVVVVDDVVTTGSSILAATNEIHKLGCNISLVLSIVDRSDGENMLLKKVNHSPLFYLSDIIKD